MLGASLSRVSPLGHPDSWPWLQRPFSQITAEWTVQGAEVQFIFLGEIWHSQHICPSPLLLQGCFEGYVVAIFVQTSGFLIKYKRSECQRCREGGTTSKPWEEVGWNYQLMSLGRNTHHGVISSHCQAGADWVIECFPQSFVQNFSSGVIITAFPVLPLSPLCRNNFEGFYLRANNV